MRLHEVSFFFLVWGVLGACAVQTGSSNSNSISSNSSTEAPLGDAASAAAPSVVITATTAHADVQIGQKVLSSVTSQQNIRPYTAAAEAPAEAAAAAVQTAAATAAPAAAAPAAATAAVPQPPTSRAAAAAARAAGAATLPLCRNCFGKEGRACRVCLHGGHESSVRTLEYIIINK